MIPAFRWFVQFSQFLEVILEDVSYCALFYHAFKPKLPPQAWKLGWEHVDCPLGNGDDDVAVANRGFDLDAVHRDDHAFHRPQPRRRVFVLRLRREAVDEIHLLAGPRHDSGADGILAHRRSRPGADVLHVAVANGRNSTDHHRDEEERGERDEKELIGAREVQRSPGEVLDSNFRIVVRNDLPSIVSHKKPVLSIKKANISEIIDLFPIKNPRLSEEPRVFFLGYGLLCHFLI